MKKLIAVLLSFVLLSLTATAGQTEEDFATQMRFFWNNYLKSGQLDEKPVWTVGDVNYDDTINAADALMALQYGVHPDWFSLRYNFEDIRELFEGVMFGHFDLLWRNPYFLTPSYRPYWFNPYSVAYENNSIFVSDVTGDCTVDAADALAILQYAVGKRTAFDRTDFVGNDSFLLLPWPDDWRPGMVLDVTTLTYHETLVNPENGDVLEIEAFHYTKSVYVDCIEPCATAGNLPWDFYDPDNWTYLPGYYVTYILPLKEANGG